MTTGACASLRVALAATALLGLGCEPEPSPFERARARFAELSEQGLEIEANRILARALGECTAAERAGAQALLARNYHRVGLYPAAVEAASAALDAGHADPETRYVLGDAQRELQRFDAARATLDDLLAAHPEHARARLAVARILWRKGESGEALPLFDAYFEKDADAPPEERAEAMLDHGRALREARRYQDAADRFAELLERDPLEPAYYSELAQTLYRMRLREPARQLERAYSKLSENAFEVHAEEKLRRTGATAFSFVQRALNLTRQYRYRDAFANYRRAFALDSDDPRPRVFGADLYLKFRRHREATAMLEEGLRLGIRPASGLHWSLARVHLEEERPEDAKRSALTARDALAREPDSRAAAERGGAPPFSLELVLARAALESGDTTLARRAAEAAGRLAPESWEAAYWSGRAAFATGDFETAAAALRTAENAGGAGFPDLHLYAARAELAAGRADSARQRLREWLRIDPGYLAAYEELEQRGWLEGEAERERLARLRQERREVEALEQRVDTTPLERCGEAYLELGKRYLARRDRTGFDCLFLAADLLPENTEVRRLLLGGLRGGNDDFPRLKLLRELRDLGDTDPAVLRETAATYLRYHLRLAEAERLARGLLRVAPDATSYRLLGLALATRANAAEAIEVLSQGAGRFPDDTPLRETLERLRAGEPNGRP